MSTRFVKSAQVVRRMLVAWLLATATVAAASSGPYDEAADARAEIRAALREGSRAKIPVLVVFGANWCADCKMLDAAFSQGASARLIKANFRVVKVNVGRFDRNADIAASYGVPLKKGIPAVAVLSPQGTVMYATAGGELADARAMGENGIFAFFSEVSGRLPK
ncbi:MAG: thioredoxin family protein [Casimicrobiaceae bacterium]